MPRAPPALACNVSLGRRQRQWSSPRAGGGSLSVCSCPSIFFVSPESRWAAPGLDMSYNYVVTAQKPTAVNGCVTGEAARAGDPGDGGSWGEPRPREARGPRVAARTGPREWKALAAEGPPTAHGLKEAVSTRAFGGVKAALEGPLSFSEVTWPRGQGRAQWDREWSVSCLCGVAWAARLASCG